MHSVKVNAWLEFGSSSLACARNYRAGKLHDDLRVYIDNSILSRSIISTFFAFLFCRSMHFSIEKLNFKNFYEKNDEIKRSRRYFSDFRSECRNFEAFFVTAYEFARIFNIKIVETPRNFFFRVGLRFFFMLFNACCLSNQAMCLVC